MVNTDNRTPGHHRTRRRHLGDLLRPRRGRRCHRVHPPARTHSNRFGGGRPQAANPSKRSLSLDRRFTGLVGPVPGRASRDCPVAAASWLKDRAAQEPVELELFAHTRGGRHWGRAPTTAPAPWSRPDDRPPSTGRWPRPPWPRARPQPWWPRPGGPWWPPRRSRSPRMWVVARGRWSRPRRGRPRIGARWRAIEPGARPSRGTPSPRSRGWSQLALGPAVVPAHAGVVPTTWSSRARDRRPAAGLPRPAAAVHR